MKYTPDLVPVKPQGYVALSVGCGIILFLQLISQYFLAPGFGGRDILTSALVLRPEAGPSVWYRMLTYAVVHGGIWHALFNVLVLAFTGRVIEEQIGRRRFLFLFFLAAYFCGAFTYLHILLVRQSTVLGASGAIAALLYVYWRMNPDAQVLLFFIIPLPIKYVMYGMITLDFLGTIFPLHTGLAHPTHFAGYLFGYLYLRYGDSVQDWFENQEERRRVQAIRREQVKAQSRRSFYDNEIDPILKKISEQGINSLSDIEKRILKEAGKNK